MYSYYPFLIVQRVRDLSKREKEVNRQFIQRPPAYSDRLSIPYSIPPHFWCVFQHRVTLTALYKWFNIDNSLFHNDKYNIFVTAMKCVVNGEMKYWSEVLCLYSAVFVVKSLLVSLMSDHRSIFHALFQLFLTDSL